MRTTQIPTRVADRYVTMRTRSGPPRGAQILLKWSETEGRLNLRWTETGGPTIESPTRKGFGGQIIERMIAQLNGKTSFDWRPEGLVCEINLHVV
jgi:two-component sensor histidine kinase